MLREIDIAHYLTTSGLPLIDVRSPREYAKGHIPGAVNIPLFTDAERAHIGTVYKQQSQEKAIELGYQYVTPKLQDFITQSRLVAPDGKVAVHCWRGGMRSRGFAEHLLVNGFNEVHQVIGGYKAFRNYTLGSLAHPARLHIIGGYTGSGKTEILKVLKEQGEQVIDLEALARHKGSAFGAIGSGTQPTEEQFGNDLFWQWKDLDINKPIWLEDESHNIGAVNIPLQLYDQMRAHEVYFLDIPREERAKHLVNTYAHTDDALLAKAIYQIAKRLGGQHVTAALEQLEKGNYYEVAMITLIYYDKYYLKSLSKRSSEMIYRIELPDTDARANAEVILKFITAKSSDE
jgi:tRNA 2-selenouridine synthase